MVSLMTRHVELGPPGTGKTTTLLNIVQSAIGRGIPPERIAYLAFTRKAAYEAQERAMVQFNFDENRFPYFRTLHSLAFKQLGMQRDEVMTNTHYRKFGKALGVEFRGIYDEDLGLHTGDGLGDKCSRLESLARVGIRTIEDQYNITQVNDLTLHAVKQYHHSLMKYKKENGLYDFTDMLESYESTLPIDICIIDEAQDLSSLQYKMAIRASLSASEVYIAGDDDQAIFGWAGADITKFLSLKGKKRILPKSYRIPSSVHSLAGDVVKRIKNRYPKEWQPRDEKGSVEYVVSEQDIDFSAEGTWMLLSRSKYLLNRYKQAVRQQGFAYNIYGKSSLDSEETRAIISWEKMRKGESISNIAPDEREYLRSCLRNGEKFSSKPRITISTIHQSKGGEADNLVLLTDMGKLSWENLGGDEENRVWYVALTRTKQNLFLVRPRGLRYFEV